jgi:hypothetical protein
MAFDAKAFSKAAFEPRTADVCIEELKDWFGGEAPIFRVRGLSGIELAQALEAAQTSQSRAELAEALLDGTDGAKVEAVKDAFGLGKGVPDELIRYHELVIRGTVEPKLTRDVSVKLAERFPVDHKQLALKILALTGQGQLVKKKPSVCSATLKSAPA